MANQPPTDKISPNNRRKSRWPRVTIDFSSPRHRRYIYILVIVLFALTSGFVFGGYKAYEYTESSEFCGQICHPMFSQFERFEISDHVNVKCAECHIGPGADFFVKSKIDGLRQVYATIRHTYTRPIKSPVRDLRPARETCETCHTPTSYKDNIVKSITHYDNDKSNTPVRSTLILKMGGWKGTTGIAHGIHWHITNKVYYIAPDAQRQIMSWVGVEQPDGTMKEYYARDMLTMGSTSYVDRARERGEMRLLDCIDCHNRAAHLIPPPNEIVDEAIQDGILSAELPFIRAKGIEVLSQSYNSTAEADIAIDELADFYRIGFPGVYETRELEVLLAIAELKRIYRSTNFPEMNLNWASNPNNETHTPDPGCFRCHDGRHIRLDDLGNEIGEISVKCNLCHSVPIIGRGQDILVEAPVIVGEVPETHVDFRWTIEHRDINEAEKLECYVCHGQGFCNNGVCHTLDHPANMLYSHAEIYRAAGDPQVCYPCHQNITCTKCHPGGVVDNP